MPKISPQKSGIMYLSLTLPDIEISIFTLGRMLKFQELTCRIRVFNLWLACEYSRLPSLPSLLAAKAVSRERRLRFNNVRKFHTDDVESVQNLFRSSDCST